MIIKIVNLTKYWFWEIVILGLFLPFLSFATPPTTVGTISYSGYPTGNIYYTTPCGETSNIGGYYRRKCSRCGHHHRRPCCPCCREINSGCNGGWTEYAADTGCGKKIYKRTCTASIIDNCCSRDDECEVTCDTWKVCEDCGSWQKATTTASCHNVTKASTVKPNCICKGECIDQPLNSNYSPPRYYSNSIYPPDPWNPTSTYQMNANDIYLPVKIDWDDVRGWKSGWQTNSEKKVVEKCSLGNERCIADYPTNLSNCKNNCRQSCYKKMASTTPPFENLYQYRLDYYACLVNCENDCDDCTKPPPNNYCTSASGCTATCSSPDKCYPKSEFIKSYVIKIWDATSTTGALYLHHYGVTTTAYTEVLATSSEFVPPDSCFFNSSSTYYWTVKACCNANGTDCGPESATSTFTTNSAPEPIYPLDADWNGTGTVKNIPTVPTTSTKLRWCSDSKMWEHGSTGLDLYLLSATNTPYYHPYRRGIPYKFFQTCDTCVYSKIATTSKVGYDYYYHQFSDDKIPNFFTKITSYFWKAITCMFYGMGCGKESQGWRFQTASTTLEKVSLISPSDGELVPLPVHLKWSHIQGANSYFYEFWEEGSVTSTTGTVPFGRGEVSLGELELNKKYIWRVKPCWDFEGEKCENWSATSSFITTLAPPTLNSPISTSSTFPISFDWGDVPFAEYYILQISSTSSPSHFASSSYIAIEKKVGKQSQTSVDFSPPKFIPEKTYYWRVRACLGSFCGDWSGIEKFGTELPSIPTNPSPSDGENLFSFLPYDLLYKPSLSWSKSNGAKFYQVTIGYGTENATCTDKLGKTIVNKVVSQPSLSLNSDLKCEGTYFWTVRACLDSACTKDYASDWANQGFCTTTKDWAGSSFWETLNSKITTSSPGIFELCSATSTHKDTLIDRFFWSFNFTKPTPAQEEIGGLVPCHRSFDNPNTPWNEREPCQIKHLFYLLINVIDFVLWKLGLIVLALLVLATGFVLYFAPYLIPEETEPIVRVKSLWKAAGIGYFVIFFAWSIINLILVLIGYHFEFFGKWWQFKL